MKTRKVVQAVTVAVLTAAVAAPALSAEGNLVDLKKVEAQIVAAQNQVVGGKLDEGLAALQAARAQAVTADLAARAEFVGKLAEVRMAERLGDQARVLAALNNAFKQAKQPDQVEAVWRTGLAVAKDAVVGAGNAAPVIDLLAKGPGPAMKQFAASVELAKLRIATGNVGAAEAELRNAAKRATSERDWSQWAAVVNQLAVAVDGGQSPQAGADVFARMGEATRSDLAQVMLDVAEGRFLLSRGRLDDVRDIVCGITANAAAKDQAVPVLSLGYALAGAFQRAGNSPAAEQALAQVESFAKSLPATAPVAIARARGLMALGMSDRAAEVVWQAAQATEDQRQRDQLLEAFGNAMVASGQVSAIAPRLRSMNAPASVYVAVAAALVKGGNSADAMKVIAAVQPAAFAEDAGSAAALTAVMKQIQTQRQQIAKDQGARVRAIASAFGAAAKKAEDPKVSAELAKQAAALTALATQVEK